MEARPAPHHGVPASHHLKSDSLPDRFHDHSHQITRRVAEMVEGLLVRLGSRRPGQVGIDILDGSLEPVQAVVQLGQLRLGHHHLPRRDAQCITSGPGFVGALPVRTATEPAGTAGPGTLSHRAMAPLAPVAVGRFRHGDDSTGAGTTAGACGRTAPTPPVGAGGRLTGGRGRRPGWPGRSSPGTRRTPGSGSPARHRHGPAHSSSSGVATTSRVSVPTSMVTSGFASRL